MKNILLIDDNEDFRDAATTVLRSAGYDIWEAACPKDALAILDQEEFDIILCDLHMPFSSDSDSTDYITSSEVGLRTIQELVTIFPNTPIVAISATPKHYLKRLARYLDPVPAFPKPVHMHEMLDLVNSLANLENAKEIQ